MKRVPMVLAGLAVPLLVVVVAALLLVNPDRFRPQLQTARPSPAWGM